MKFSKEQKSFFILMAFILLILASGIYVYFMLRKDSVRNRLSETELLVRVLFVIDDGNGEALCSEVIMYNPGEDILEEENIDLEKLSCSGAVLEIPGNLGSIFEQSLGRVDRIDAVYKEKGIDVFRNEIERFIGKKLPFRICISLSSFCELSDYLGGLNVFIPVPVDVKAEDGHRILLPSGAVTLDGDKVRDYMTYLLPDETESDRNERLNNAFLAFLSALKENRFMFLSQQNFGTFLKYFETDAGAEGELELFAQICSLDVDRLIKNSVKGEYKNVAAGESGGNVRLFFPEDSGRLLRQTVNATTQSLLLKESLPDGRSYVIEVLNGTTLNRLAGETGERLKSAGYDVLHVANADRSDYEKTVIIDHIGNPKAAEVLGGFINCSNIQEEKTAADEADPDSVSKYDFTIILGRN
ncbi:MAG: LCP family protein [Treponema sp.]|nr:LCP family protein [Treponema sp.]